LGIQFCPMAWFGSNVGNLKLYETITHSQLND